jgi:hypothetical protein
MKKFLRFLFLLIFVIAAAILILAFIEPREITITRREIIQAPANTVFSHITDFTKWNAWSSMLQHDSAAKITISGNIGEAGSSLAWVGDDGKIGTGVIKNEGVDSNTMKYTFTVTRPGEMAADGTISARDSGLYTIVTWKFHKSFAFLANAALVIVDMDKYIGGDLESSLGNLKTYIEQYAEPVVVVKEVEYPGALAAGIRDTVAWADLSTFFGDTYNLFDRVPKEKISGPHIGVYYQWDTTKQEADLLAGVVVADTAVPVNGIGFFLLPGAKACMAVHKGGYGTLRRTHSGIERYMGFKQQAHWLVIEEYPVYPGNEVDSNKWVTNIYYLLQ